MSKRIAVFMVLITLLSLIVAPAGVTNAQVPPAGPDPGAVRAAAGLAGLQSLTAIGVPQQNNLGDFLNPGPGAKSMAIVLGKALFWDQQVGSDGQACASCHFAAGADNRTKNQVNPGLRNSPADAIFGNSGITSIGGYPQLAANYDLAAGDMPTHELSDPQVEDFNHRILTRDTNDVITSQGVFNANFGGTVAGQMKDLGTAVADPVFNVAGVNVRRNPPRNTPSVINAIFNFDNFWDGRARNRFNGVNPLGPLDPSATILVNVNNVLTPTFVSIPNSSLASQATGPVLSDVEMSFAGRTWPDVGKKLAAARPLAFQKVHADDSSLGPFSRARTDPTLNGLTHATYADLVKAVFQSRYWDSDRVITFNPDGSRLINPPGTPNGYTQMEANFTLFFGLAVQAYVSTLISDRTRFDLFMEGDNAALDADELEGLLIFINAGTLAQQANPIFTDVSMGACTACHGSTLFSDATIPAQGVEGPIELEVAPVLLDGVLKLGTELVLLDNGYYNIGVRPTAEDLGRGGSELGKPLSVSRQALAGLPFAPPIPVGAPANPRVHVDGAVKVPILRNVELTGPYFHNGGMDTLRDVMEFYRRHGDFSDVNISQLDGPLAEVALKPPDAVGRDFDVDRLIRFLLTLTDERVRTEMAPFDHPQLVIPNGHPGNSAAITPPFDIVNGVNQAQDTLVNIPAIGKDGRQVAGLAPVKGFLSTGAIQGIKIALRPGWNTLSTPIRLHASSDTWGEFRAVNGLNAQLAYRWDGTAFVLVDDAYALAPLDAIFVLMNTSGTADIIPLDGISGPASKALSPGWNFVGAGFIQSQMQVRDALLSALWSPANPANPSTVPLWGYSQVVSPTTNLFNWTYLRDSLVVPNMIVGEGYWVSMVNAGQVNGFTTTPWPPR